MGRDGITTIHRSSDSNTLIFSGVDLACRWLIKTKRRRVSLHDITLRVRKLLLASEGYSVLTASSGEEGLEVFKKNPVDLVIADHFLSDKTGTEIAREMKQLKPEVPILIMSAALEKPPAWSLRMSSWKKLSRRRFSSIPSLACWTSTHS